MTGPETSAGAPAGTAPAGELSARERFHAAAAAHAAAMPPERGLAWVRRHGLLVLARHPELPTALAEPLALDLRRTLAANLLWIDLFRMAADALSEIGIPVCALKGIHLLATVYAGDPETRVLTDLDLLVPAERLDEAADRLASTLGLAVPAGLRGSDRFTRTRHLAGRGVMIDLHSRLSVRHSPTSAWRDLAPEPARLHGRSVRALDRETTWIHLMTHWVRHGPYEVLRWVEDLLRWRETGIDAARAARIAWRLGALTSLLAGERALALITGEPPPVALEDAAGALARTRAGAVERWFWRGMHPDPLAAGVAPESTAPGRARAGAAVLLADGPLDACRVLAAKAGELRSRRQGRRRLLR